MIEVHNAPERSRYEIHVDGTYAGFAHYRRHGGSLIFDHTVIEEQFAGQGLASDLVGSVLDDVRAHQGRIVAECNYVAGWLSKNQDYDDLVDHELAAQIQGTSSSQG